MTTEQALWERHWKELQQDNELQKLWEGRMYAVGEPDDHLSDDWEMETDEHYQQRIRKLSEEATESEIGRYGVERRQYLKKYKPEEYQEMQDDLSLLRYLVDTNIAALNQEATLVYQMEQAQGVTEELKVQDQMKWVGMENNILHSAQEIVRNNLIYA